MTKAKDKRGEGQPVEPADFGRLTDAFKDMPVHPLLAHPAAAFMAATVVGLGIASQLTGVMLAALQGAAGALDRARHDAPVRHKPEEDAPASTTAPVKAKAAAKPETASPAPAKATKPQAVKPAGKTQTAKPAVKPAPKGKRVAKASAKADDLKRIGGIGPKAEQMLKARGIARFSDIAGWTKADIARLDAELGLGGRIERDDWVGQAKAFAGGAA